MKASEIIEEILEKYNSAPGDKYSVRNENGTYYFEKEMQGGILSRFRLTDKDIEPELPDEHTKFINNTTLKILDDTNDTGDYSMRVNCINGMFEHIYPSKNITDEVIDRIITTINKSCDMINEHWKNYYTEI